MKELRQSSRFTERLPSRGFLAHEPIDPFSLVDDVEIWDKIDRRVIPRDCFKEAIESRARELEAAIRRFMECGVEVSRFSIEEHPDETRLCIDGVSRFVWRIHFPGLPQYQP